MDTYTDLAQGAIDIYNGMRQKIEELVRAEPELMGEYAWLSAPLSEWDMTLEWTKDGIMCYGNTYTMQTGGCNEYFEFTVPHERFVNLVVK